LFVCFKEEPSTPVKRGAVLTAKTLQQLATNMPYQQTNPHHELFNEFLKKNG